MNKLQTMTSEEKAKEMLARYGSKMVAIAVVFEITEAIDNLKENTNPNELDLMWIASDLEHWQTVRKAIIDLELKAS